MSDQILEDSVLQKIGDQMTHLACLYHQQFGKAACGVPYKPKGIRLNWNDRIDCVVCDDIFRSGLSYCAFCEAE